MLERQPSDEALRSFLNSLSYPQKDFLFGVVDLNIAGLEISWDFDLILMMTQDPVFRKADKDFGTNYKDRKVISWSSVAEWLVEDGKMQDFENAKEYEEKLWNDPEIIRLTPPNKSLQVFSYAAWLRGIKQTISTSRPSTLEEVTKIQVENYFPWLVGNVNQRSAGEPGITGRDGIGFKVGHVSELYQRNHGVIHFDDSMTTIRKLLELHPDMDVLGFPATKEPYSDLVGKRRLFFPDITLFESLITYSPELPRGL